MLCNTNSSSFSKNGVIGSLVLSCLRCAATVRMPSLSGMFVYRDETSKVTNSAPSGSLFSDLSLPKKTNLYNK